MPLCGTVPAEPDASISGMEIFSPRGTNPGNLWELNGSVVRSYQKASKGFVFELGGGVRSRMVLPRSNAQPLHFTHPILQLQLQVPAAEHVTVALEVADAARKIYRFVCSSSFRRAQPDYSQNKVQVPIVELRRGCWQHVCFDLPALVRGYNASSDFAALRRVEISGRCALRRIFCRPRAGPSADAVNPGDGVSQADSGAGTGDDGRPSPGPGAGTSSTSAGLLHVPPGFDFPPGVPSVAQPCVVPAVAPSASPEHVVESAAQQRPFFNQRHDSNPNHSLGRVFSRSQKRPRASSLQPRQRSTMAKRTPPPPQPPFSERPQRSHARPRPSHRKHTEIATFAPSVAAPSPLQPTPESPRDVAHVRPDVDANTALARAGNELRRRLFVEPPQPRRQPRLFTRDARKQRHSNPSRVPRVVPVRPSLSKPKMASPRARDAVSAFPAAAANTTKTVHSGSGREFELLVEFNGVLLSDGCDGDAQRQPRSQNGVQQRKRVRLAACNFAHLTAQLRSRFFHLEGTDAGAQTGAGARQAMRADQRLEVDMFHFSQMCYVPLVNLEDLPWLAKVRLRLMDTAAGTVALSSSSVITGSVELSAQGAHLTQFPNTCGPAEPQELPDRSMHDPLRLLRAKAKTGPRRAAARAIQARIRGMLYRQRKACATLFQPVGKATAATAAATDAVEGEGALALGDGEAKSDNTDEAEDVGGDGKANSNHDGDTDADDGDTQGTMRGVVAPGPSKTGSVEESFVRDLIDLCVDFDGMRGLEGDVHKNAVGSCEDGADGASDSPGSDGASTQVESSSEPARQGAITVQCEQKSLIRKNSLSTADPLIALAEAERGRVAARKSFLWARRLSEQQEKLLQQEQQEERDKHNQAQAQTQKEAHTRKQHPGQEQDVHPGNARTLSPDVCALLTGIVSISVDLVVEQLEECAWLGGRRCREHAHTVRRSTMARVRTPELVELCDWQAEYFEQLNNGWTGGAAPGAELLAAVTRTFCDLQVGLAVENLVERAFEGGRAAREREYIERVGVSTAQRRRSLSSPLSLAEPQGLLRRRPSAVTGLYFEALNNAAPPVPSRTLAAPQELAAPVPSARALVRACAAGKQSSKVELARLMNAISPRLHDVLISEEDDGLITRQRSTTV